MIYHKTYISLAVFGSLLLAYFYYNSTMRRITLKLRICCY